MQDKNMNSKIVSKDRGGLIQVVVLDSGEEALATLTRFANEAKITAASLTAIASAIAVINDHRQDSKGTRWMPWH